MDISESTLVNLNSLHEFYDDRRVYCRNKDETRKRPGKRRKFITPKQFAEQILDAFLNLDILSKLGRQQILADKVEKLKKLLSEHKEQITKLEDAIVHLKREASEKDARIISLEEENANIRLAESESDELPLTVNSDSMDDSVNSDKENTVSKDSWHSSLENSRSIEYEKEIVTDKITFSAEEILNKSTENISLKSETYLLPPANHNNLISTLVKPEIVANSSEIKIPIGSSEQRNVKNKEKSKNEKRVSRKNAYFKWTTEKNLKMLDAMIETLSAQNSSGTSQPYSSVKESHILMLVGQRIDCEISKIRHQINNLLGHRNLKVIKSGPENYIAALVSIRDELSEKSKLPP